VEDGRYVDANGRFRMALRLVGGLLTDEGDSSSLHVAWIVS